MRCEYCGRNNFRNKEVCVSCGALLPTIDIDRHKWHKSKSTRLIRGVRTQETVSKEAVI